MRIRWAYLKSGFLFVIGFLLAFSKSDDWLERVCGLLQVLFFPVKFATWVMDWLSCHFQSGFELGNHHVQQDISRPFQ